MAANPELAQAIGQQVEAVILQAKKDSEQRVRAEFAAAKMQLRQMQVVIEELHTRVQRTAAAGSKPGEGEESQTVDRSYLTQRITQLEQKLSTEVQALKQDLHRTILAHNHNSDLMRHHRDALDEARRKLDARTAPKVDKVEGQISKVEQLLRQGQTKQRTMEALTSLLVQMEQQVNELVAGAGYSGVVGGMLGAGAAAGPGGVAVEAPVAAGSKEDSAEFNAAAPSFVPAGLQDDKDQADEATAATSFPAPVDLPPGIDMGSAGMNIAELISKAAAQGLAAGDVKASDDEPALEGPAAASDAAAPQTPTAAVEAPVAAAEEPHSEEKS
jgi:hypothetical protein